MATNQNDLIAGSDAQQEGGAFLVGGNGDDLLLADGTRTWTAPLTALNDSGVTGTVTVTQANDQLQVNVTATGLEPNQVHPMHIHSLEQTEESSITSFDSDADGFIELAESVATAGPPAIDLQANGQFPTAAADGTLNFTANIELSSEAAELFPLELRAIEIHGLTVEATDGLLTGGEVNGTAGYKATLPVAAVELAPATAEEGATGAVLRGDNGGDTLVGGDGADLLLGSRGADVLAGQAGADQLIGGTGRDVFIVGEGADTVVDFERNLDKLVFANGTAPGDVQVTATDEGAQLTAGDATVMLVGVQASATTSISDWIA